MYLIYMEESNSKRIVVASPKIHKISMIKNQTILPFHQTESNYV